MMKEMIGSYGGAKPAASEAAPAEGAREACPVPHEEREGEKKPPPMALNEVSVMSELDKKRRELGGGSE
jgi:hypothetical protein